MVEFFNTNGRLIMVLDSDTITQKILDQVNWDTAEYNDHIADCRIYHIGENRETFTIVKREKS